MKAMLIAMVLSLCAPTLLVHAAVTAPSPTPATHKIDLNQADLSTLTGSFKGIGKKRAQAILQYRDSHKGFKSIQELADVKGLGQKFVERNKDKLQEVYEVGPVPK